MKTQVSPKDELLTLFSTRLEAKILVVSVILVAHNSPKCPIFKQQILQTNQIQAQMVWAQD